MSVNGNNSIRLACYTDTRPMLDIYAPFIVHTHTSFESEVPSEEEFRARVEDVLKRTPWLVYETDGVIAGYAYASPHRARAAYQWCVEVSVYVHEQYHRRGIGRKLYLVLFDMLRKQGFYNAYAGIALPNDRSILLHQSLGFEPVGVYKSVGYKFGKWHDVGWWGLALREHTEEKPEPVNSYQ